MTGQETRMSARSGCGLRTADGDVTTLVCDIRTIGRQLRNPETLSHPYVKSAIAELESQLADVLDHSRGRHRLTIGDSDRAATAEGMHDASVSVDTLKPNPLMATTAAELLAAMRRYRAWAGSASFRQMAIRARHAIPHLAMCRALNGEELPPLETVIAIIAGCGGEQDDQEMFAAAWRRIEAVELDLRPGELSPELGDRT